MVAAVHVHVHEAPDRDGVVVVAEQGQAIGDARAPEPSSAMPTSTTVGKVELREILGTAGSTTQPTALSARICSVPGSASTSQPLTAVSISS